MAQKMPAAVTPPNPLPENIHSSIESPAVRGKLPSRQSLFNHYFSDSTRSFEISGSQPGPEPFAQPGRWPAPSSHLTTPAHTRTGASARSPINYTKACSDPIRTLGEGAKDE